MQSNRLRVGAKLVVSTTEGEEEDEITRIVVATNDSGVVVVETARNGRVVVLRGRRDGYLLSGEDLERC